MKKSILTLLGSVLLSTQVFAVPTQTEILKNGVFRYFKNLPVGASSYMRHSLNMGDYHLLTHMHEEYKDRRKSSTPFDVLYSNSRKRYPLGDNEFTFQNSGEHFKDVMQMEFGVCAGMSLSIRRFNILAYFDPSSRMERAPARGSSQWVRFFKDKIDQVLFYKKPAIFPGVRSLIELTSHPEIKTHVQQHVIREWADSASALWRGVAQQLYSVRGTFTREEGEELHEELTYKIKELGYSPIVWLAKPNSNPFSRTQWIHVMQVLEVSPRGSQGDFKIKLWDINQPAKDSIVEVVVNSQGVPKFKGETLSEVEVLHFDDFEMAEIIKNKLDFCADNRGLCTRR